MNTPIEILQRIRAVVPSFDRKAVVKRAAVRKRKTVVEPQLDLEGIPPDILEAVAKELKL